RFTGLPAYFKHVTSASTALLERMGTTPRDYRFAIFHQPNGKFPLRVAKQLGFSAEQVETGLLVPFIGNTYSGSMLLGLTAVLDVAAPGDRIFACSYGSGAGADAFDITVTDAKARLLEAPTTMELVRGGRRLSYAIYAKYRRKIRM
ncbi:MAG: hydroxymethylglutaryl-CoA synthase, partial [Thermoplasmata archaeon]|nr:hydroxymethylglutaryl-CoA synthase [Thermoplasmata archaeon]